MKFRILLLGLAISQSILAQNPLEGDYLFAGAGIQSSRFNDAYVSPNTYQGYLGKLDLGWHTYKGKWMNNLDLSGLSGWQSPLQYPEQSSQTFNLELRAHYSLRYRLLNRGKHQLLAGLYSQNILALREHNNFNNSAQSFSGFFGYGPSIAYTYHRTDRIFGKVFSWSWQSEWNIPFGTYIIRPNYIRLYSAGELGDRGHHFLNDTWQTDLRHSLIWHRHNGNQIRLVYAWEYFQTERFNPAYGASHSLSLQLFYRL